MAKKEKMKTPNWILEGYDSKADYERQKNKSSTSSKQSNDSSTKAKGITSEKKASKTFKVRECPKCKSDEVGVVLTGEEGKKAREWECKKCGWIGTNIDEKELTEDEFMKYLDEKGEEVA